MPNEMQIGGVSKDNFPTENLLLVQGGNGRAGLRGDQPEMWSEGVEFGGEKGGAEVGPEAFGFEVDGGVAGERLCVVGVGSTELWGGSFGDIGEL